MKERNITLGEFVHMTNKAQAVCIALQHEPGVPADVREQLEKANEQLKAAMHGMLAAHRRHEILD